MSNRQDERSHQGGEEDSVFVIRCQKGDVDAFQVLVERHQKKMLNLAFRMTGDYDEACEIVQEAFLSAFRSIRKFRNDAAFSTWLYGITINQARNRLRQLSARAAHEGPSLNDPVDTAEGPIAYDPPSQDTPIVEQLERKEVQEKVQACINTLDNEHREVLVLRDIQEFSYEEIRDILKIPEGTVKSRLFRARDALKNCLKQVLGDL